MRWFVVKKGETVPYAGPYLLKLEAEFLAQGLTRIQGKEYVAVGIPVVRFYRFAARMTPEGLDVQMEPQRPLVKERGIWRVWTSKEGVHRFPAPSYLGALVVAQDHFGDPAHNSVETRF